MEFINKYSLCLVLFLLISQVALTQDVLNNYIQQGLENNLALKQKTADYKIKMAELREAKGMFFPSLSVNARYSVADGGREISIPVNTMLSGYSQYNNLINPGLNLMVPGEIKDETIPFMRPKEHETKLRLTQSLFNTDIYYNRKIKEEFSLISKADEMSYKRQLIKEIKTAYYQYLITLEVEEVLFSTRELINELIRVNERLYTNNKVTIDKVYKAEAELNKLEKKISETQKNKMSARNYFNYLLNKELNSEVQVDSLDDITPSTKQLAELKNNALESREELEMLSHYESLSEKNIKMQKGHQLPDLIAVVDYGFQGEEYQFTGDDDFVMANFVLSWDLFKGFQNKARIQQAKIEKKKIEDKHRQTEKLVQLEVVQAYYGVVSSVKSLDAARSEKKSTQKVFKLVKRQYEEGMVNLLEYLDAQNALTEAKQNFIISKYNLLIAKAELERAAGLYTFSEN